MADVGRGWDEVLLEQVIYIHRKDARIPSYLNFKNINRCFERGDVVEKRECQRFGFYLNDIDQTELQIAHQMLKSSQFLGEFISNRRGAGLQSQLKRFGRGLNVLAGTSVQRFHIGETKGFYDLGDAPANAQIKAGNILAQNIITRLQNPLPHIRIVAHLVQSNEADNNIILDTVNQIEIISGESVLSPYIVLALLNCKLVNWYVYRFVYAKATLTMHFDSPITNRIPLPDLTEKPELVEKVIAEVKRIYADRHANEKTSQARIDKYVYQLYSLSAEQIALVEANMP